MNFEQTDVAIVGAGPTGLAVAAACADSGRNGRFQLLERAPVHDWHPGMMVDFARIQITVLKDLALPRDPKSPFTFLNFLREQGRLEDFLNLRSLRASRYEFREYLRWIGDRLGSHMTLGAEVTSIEPLERNGYFDALRIVYRRNGDTHAVHAKSLVLGTGAAPAFPDHVRVSAGTRVFHSSQYLTSVERLAQSEPPRSILVVGGGQSAGEVSLDMMRKFPSARVQWMTRGYAPQSLDESHLVNQVFDPEEQAAFQRLERDQREKFLSTLPRVNYGAVETELLQAIYEESYYQKLKGRSGLSIGRFSELVEVEHQAEEARVVTRNLLDESIDESSWDAVVLCSGYRIPNQHPLLAGLESELKREVAEYVTDNEFRAQTKPGSRLRAPIYLPGLCEGSQGPAEPILSLTASRNDRGEPLADL